MLITITITIIVFLIKRLYIGDLLKLNEMKLNDLVGVNRPKFTGWFLCVKRFSLQV